MKSVTPDTVLGIDIGSVSVTMALINDRYMPVKTSAVPHGGDVFGCLEQQLSDFDPGNLPYIAVTDPAGVFLKAHGSYDTQVAVIRAARLFHSKFRQILSIGGEKFFLCSFDEDMNYTGTRSNTSCAAGTGSFLDQQALRLNLMSSANISREALKNRGEIPDIATRCAVFAKTDLIHAQQEGYQIEQICDGLCKGMARNIIHTLFKNQKPSGNIVFCGGVSLNQAVKKHLETLLNHPLTVDPHSMVYKAAGAAVSLLDDIRSAPRRFVPLHLHSISDLFIRLMEKEKSVYPPLTLTLSDYPDFETFESYMDDSVEVDIYQDPGTLSDTEGPLPCYLGIDVGSTSTKSIIITKNRTPVAGFYTKTASKPVIAVQNIFRAADSFIRRSGLNLSVSGCGTTGSGRKISAAIVGADLSPDEITAHARAASHLNPLVDTIIEIGGQDAKFTTMKNGVVTSSTMNTVCAAGTGSFIEEQALKLNCPLEEYSDRTENVASPVSSDRCTVFMERDLNHFLSEGYQISQVLASVLHSVRDNYLTKVANIGKIGDQILFQGATAKNRALIAAFEQKLRKPIHVSKYCHLTGALGTALLAREKMLETGQAEGSAFKGFEIWKTPIPIKKEVCQICSNHCKITIADINGQIEAYGFLCGRDYDTKKFIAPKTRFHLIRERKKIIHDTPRKPVKHELTIGIPAGLHLFEDTAFWKIFFNELGVNTITSEQLSHPISLGKTVSGAEFCAPVTALHGHVLDVSDRADFIFLPFYFEERKKEKDLRRQHCYYTQFAPSLISCIPGFDRKKLISPLVRYLYTGFQTKIALYRALRSIDRDFSPSFLDINRAYDKASAYKETSRKKLQDIYAARDTKKLSVLFVGRPYTVLAEKMNAAIPDIFSTLDVPAFFQDMLDMDAVDFEPIMPLLREIHWKYAAQILKAAFIAANTPNLYPVYVTSFKCSPDSFCVEYFKQIMEQVNKPYLVLELDEHDSSVGYETRVEAAVQAFLNHQKLDAPVRVFSGIPATSGSRQTRESKTIVFPNWDAHTGRLLVAILRKEGVDAILMEETEATIKQSLLTNTGQCIPLNAVASGFIHTVRKHGLEPSRAMLWLNHSDIACNIRMYPFHIKRILEKEKNGFERAQIYMGELSLFDISVNAARNAYFGYMFGGLVKSIACRLRPYEVTAGQTDAAESYAMQVLEEMFRNGLDKEKSLENALRLFRKIDIQPVRKSKVGIFGDLYIRDNPIINQDLISFIESHGGEAIITPYYKYVKIIASSYFKKWFAEGKYRDLISNRLIYSAMQALEKKYYKYFESFLGDLAVHQNQSSQEILATYGILPEHTGESMDNILKIHHILTEHPDLDLLVQTNPSFCCPALITEAMAAKIEETTGVPIVTITYDISGGNKNRRLIPYLTSIKQRRHPQSRKASGWDLPGR